MVYDIKNVDDTATALKDERSLKGEAVVDMEKEEEAQKEGEALTVTVAVPLPEPPAAALGVPVAREALQAVEPWALLILLY